MPPGVRTGEPSSTAAPRRRGARGPLGATAALVVAVALAAGTAWAVGGAGADDGPGPTGSTVLTVVDHSEERAVHTRPVEVGETFELRHTHSVTRREVVETFSVLDAETVAIESLVFDEHGPNLPAGPAHVGEHATYTTDGRVVRVDHHGHPIGSLPLVIGSDGVNHRVIFSDGQRLRLLDVAERGSRVEIVVAPPQGEGAAG